MASVRHVALTTDCWTSITKESYMTVTVHYVSEKQKMISRVLNTIQLEERHTSENFAAQLMKIASDWNLTGKIAGVVTDNAYNIKHVNIKKKFWRSHIYNFFLFLRI